MDAVDPTNETALAVYYQTHPLSHRLGPRIVAASVLVALLGAYTTLLLLGRRTAASGWRNWALLVLAATTEASVGIWSTHYLGTVALVASEEVTWYIQFNPGFTVLSLFVPLVALIIAFVTLGTDPFSAPSHPNPDEDRFAAPLRGRRTNEKSNDDQYDGGAGDDASSYAASTARRFGRFAADRYNTRLVLGGILFGGTVALMHYSANFSASFAPRYSVAPTVAAIFLACIAASVALLIFFRLHSQWQNNWWKRSLCAGVLGSGVIGMHYTGVYGTHWYVREGQTTGFTLGKRESAVITIAISVMCAALCVICFIVILSDYIVTKNARLDARRVVVASATFDRAGRLLVKPDGMLPTSVVETNVPLKDILAELDTRQTTFQWLYAVSWDWSILEPFLPRLVAAALNGSLLAGADRRGLVGRRWRKQDSHSTSYSSSRNAAELALFRDRCLEAAHLMATEMQVPMARMGVLFDGVLPTATKRRPPSEGRRKDDAPQKGDEESSLWSATTAGPRHEGVMLFLVRELSGEGADNPDGYARRGYRFADTRFCSPVLADRVAVERRDVDALFDRLKLYARRGNKPCVRPGGVYVGFFGVRPSAAEGGGLDALVYSFCHHQCPAYRLPDLSRVSSDLRDWLASLAGATLRDIAALCENELDAPQVEDMEPAEHDLLASKSSLLLGIDAMLAGLRTFTDLEVRSRLAAEVLEVPSSLDDSTEPASVIMFEAVLPAAAPTHGRSRPSPSDGRLPPESADPASTFVWMPYSLFAKSQMMLLRGAAAQKFAREVRADMTKRYPSPAEPMQASSGPHHPQSVWSGPWDDFAKPTPAQLEAAHARRRKSSFSSVPLHLRPHQIASNPFSSPAYSDGGTTVVGSPFEETKKVVDHDSASPSATDDTIHITPRPKAIPVFSLFAHTPSPTQRAGSEASLSHPLLGSPIRAVGAKASNPGARRHADDWHARRLDSLERVDADGNLAGAEW